jgi:hypothetical protein
METKRGIKMTCHIHEKINDDCVLCVPKIQLTKLIRFKFQFSLCENIDDLINELDEIKKELNYLKSINAEYDQGEIDWHFFDIVTNDKNLIKELQNIGFYDPNE